MYRIQCIWWTWQWTKQNYYLSILCRIYCYLMYIRRSLHYIMQKQIIHFFRADSTNLISASTMSIAKIIDLEVSNRFNHFNWLDLNGFYAFDRCNNQCKVVVLLQVKFTVRFLVLWDWYLLQDLKLRFSLFSKIHQNLPYFRQIIFTELSGKK